MTKELSEMTPEEIVKELEGARAQLKLVNAESAGRRKQLEAIDKEKKELAEKTLSESEKLQAEVKALTTDHKALQDSLNAERVRTAVIGEATKLGFTSPEDAYSLIDLSQVETTDGKVSGFSESLKALAKSGRLTMTDGDQTKSDGLGTPAGKTGKPTTKKGAQQAIPKIRI